MTQHRAAALIEAAQRLHGRADDSTIMLLLDRARAADPSLTLQGEIAAVLTRMGRTEAASDLLNRMPVWRNGPGGPSADAAEALRRTLGLPSLPTPSDRLIVSFCFPPFADSAGYVMAKRLAQDGRRSDVISNDMSRRAGLDGDVYAALAPLIGQHLVLDAANDPGSAESCRDFAEAAAAALQSGRFGRRRYAEIYSRAMWPQSHFAAARLLTAGAADRWVAEFSDPARRNIHGEESPAPADPKWLGDSGIAALLTARGFPVPHDASLMYWCEYLPLCLADEIVFTNPHQRDAMLAQDYPEAVRNRAADRAVIRPHPQPAPVLLKAVPEPPAARDDRPQPIRIGSFGHANPRRGGGEILSALTELPLPLRARFTLHLHGRVSEAFSRDVERLGLATLIRQSPSLPYLEALGRMRSMDYLLISDTARAAWFAVNPYLPSKLSDYRAARRPLLALVEPGSTLSETELPAGSQRVALNDTKGLAGILRHIAMRRSTA